MSASNFNTKNDTFRKLMGSGLSYRIPRFQRDYSWEEDHWDDLWMDIKETVREGGEPAHYMGYLVLQSKDEKIFDVIDGQQRLTTLSLIVLAALKNLQRLIDDAIHPENNQQRLEQIRQTYIGFLDPVTLLSQAKLILNRNNDHYYQNYLVPLGNLPTRGFRASEHGLRKAFEWFDRRVREFVKGETDQGSSLARLIETMSDRLFFTVITVTDELNAYKVFETLNARGVRLSATDLLKNYLFAVLHGEGVHEQELKVLEDRWEGMVGRLGNESFPIFLRTHWNSRHMLVRQTELFKTIRGKIRQRGEAFRLLNEMDEDVETYLGLTQPETGSWSPESKRYAATLKMFNVRQPFPLLLAASRIFDSMSTDFEKLLHACVIISFRYNVIGNFRASDQERTYNTLAQRIGRNELSSIQEVITGLKELYPKDSAFKAAFTEKSIRTSQSRNKRVVRYILSQLESHLTHTNHDFDSKRFNIEHILPQNPPSDWEAFSNTEQEAMTFRLGNMVLLETTKNRNLGTKPWPAKQEVFQESQFALAKRVATENDNWTPERIAKHQAWMAIQATAIWQIPQL
ncbi:MAG: DUF262 domain-containing protein [Magnetococcales bacterium]|nr:DUF262 domain-containing protein [Magnetococcales bacterium]